MAELINIGTVILLTNDALQLKRLSSGTNCLEAPRTFSDTPTHRQHSHKEHRSAPTSTSYTVSEELEGRRTAFSAQPVSSIPHPGYKYITHKRHLWKSSTSSLGFVLKIKPQPHNSYHDYRRIYWNFSFSCSIQSNWRWHGTQWEVVKAMMVMEAQAYAEHLALPWAHKAFSRAHTQLQLRRLFPHPWSCMTQPLPQDSSWHPAAPQTVRIPSSRPNVPSRKLDILVRTFMLSEDTIIHDLFSLLVDKWNSSSVGYGTDDVTYTAITQHDPTRSTETDGIPTTIDSDTCSERSFSRITTRSTGTSTTYTECSCSATTFSTGASKTYTECSSSGTTATGSSGATNESRSTRRKKKLAMRKEQRSSGGTNSSDGSPAVARGRPKLPPRTGDVHCACPFYANPGIRDIYCGEKCLKLERIVEHVIQHIKPFQCINCGARFTKVFSRDRHEGTGTCRHNPNFVRVTPEELSLVESIQRRGREAGEVHSWETIYRKLFPNQPVPDDRCEYFKP
ncbi:hypothetical protein EX30DRAFT_173628 [Ascodesmis nigricans]|uniref:Uncharacterized protein n=1 Tax=Ascodesmis nigricans TaxID=341454 RepID=A0A4S2MLL3_9PEZI|nr:hypothetical protein EX30DRAFT_173628 [Ascodesmis nigricans]